MTRHAFFLLFLPLLTDTYAHPTNSCVDTSTTDTHTHREYPLDSDLFPAHEELAPANSAQPAPSAPELELEHSSALTTQPALIPEPESATHSAESTTTTAEQGQCTNSTMRALAAGCCIGTGMGFASYHTRSFFPYNWIADYFVRILLVSAATNECTAKNKDLMRDSSWALDWLVYGYLKLHSWWLV